MYNAQGKLNENLRSHDIKIWIRFSSNIFLCDNPSVGKSKFINLVMNELISRERYINLTLLKI